MFGRKRKSGPPVVLSTAGESLHVASTESLSGEELIEVAPGRYVRVADLLAMPAELPVLDEDGEPYVSPE